MRFDFRFVVLLFAYSTLQLASTSVQSAGAADSIIADESSIEAAILYNIALFTEWPEFPDDEFRICVLAGDSMRAALEPVKKKQLKEHPISVIKVSSAPQVLTCQMLFVGRSEHASIENLARQIGNQPVMVVSEENGYDPKDVIIQLVKLQGRIAFKINRTEAQKKSLTVSSKLLKLAVQIY